MKRLYYVACYSHRQNHWARFLLTAKTSMDARRDCEDENYKVDRVVFVCETAGDIWMEL